ncbi:Uncharacterised protein [Candidatus Tiddalikarchaeum anstoanum]|nr:Uncharacterised protein [Candidatus Tiddalikarchaeum anstoanum]
MNILDEIKNSRKNSKQLVEDLTKSVLSDKVLVKQLVDGLKSGSKTEKGVIADVMKHVSGENPDLLAPYVDELVGSVNSDIPRVMWGVPESIGNLAKKFPDKAVKAVPNLLLNTKSDSTVVKWCAAYALSEIFKYNLIVRKTLLPEIEELVKKEKNNGVKNVYVKVLKEISRK